MRLVNFYRIFERSNPKINYCMTDFSGNELSKEKTRLESDLSMNESYNLKWS